MMMFRKSTLAVLATLVACLAAAPALAVVEFTWDVPEHIIVADEFAFIEIFTTITNTGDERDTYDIHKEQLVPDDLIWSASICVGDFCYAPNINDVSTESIDPGNSVSIGVAYFFGTEPGTGYSSLRVTSQGDPGLDVTENFVAIHTGCDVLAVDDTGDAFFAFDHVDAVAAQLGGRFLGHWPRDLQEVDLASLQAFPATFWLTGENGETLDAADRAFLLKAAVKELAVRDGLVATFMGRPFADQGGSGFHLHVSLAGADGNNAFADAAAPDGLSPLSGRSWRACSSMQRGCRRCSVPPSTPTSACCPTASRRPTATGATTTARRCAGCRSSGAGARGWRCAPATAPPART